MIYIYVYWGKLLYKVKGCTMNIYWYELFISIRVNIVDRCKGFLMRGVVGEKRSDIKIFAKVFKDGRRWCLDWQWERDGVILRPMGDIEVSKNVTRYHWHFNRHGGRTFDVINQFWKFVEIFQHFSKVKMNLCPNIFASNNYIETILCRHDYLGLIQKLGILMYNEPTYFLFEGSRLCYMATLLHT